MPEPGRDLRPGPRGRHWLGRSASQLGLIAALLAVFAVCAAVAGTGALVLTIGDENALSAAVALADGTELDGGTDVTTVYVNGATGEGAVPPDAATLAPLVRRTLASTAAPYRARVSLWTTSPTLFLDGADVRRGYLLDADTITANAALRSGSWPSRPTTDRIPVAIPATTAEALGVRVGAELSLSTQRGEGQDAGRTFPLVVTGTFTPAGAPAWSRDLLQGRGYDPDYLWLPTYGPFVVAQGTLEALAAPVDRVVAVLDPDLAGNARGVPGLTRRLDALADQLRDSAGPSVGSVRVWSPLGADFSRMQAELGVTDAVVLSVLVLVLALGAAATALLARALLGRRGTELTLLRDRGASGSQLVRAAAAEAAVLAVVAAAVAAPLALAAYGIASHPPAGVPGPGETGLGPGFFLSLLAGALLPAAVLVMATAREQPRGRRLPISGTLARSGLDVMAALLAVVAYLQLRAHTPQPGDVDPLLVAAPAACVLAVAALATRLLPLLTRAADRAARRGKAFVLPMAAWHVARGGAVRGSFLVVLAAGVCTMGVSFLATWPGSQDDQAAALVGADLVVGQPGGPGTAHDLTTATGGIVTPVADRPVVLGSRPEGVSAVALDAALADRMLTSRPPDGATWGGVMAQLAPAEGGAPLVVATERQDVTVVGRLRTSAVLPGLPTPDVTATPTLVLADDFGVTMTRTGSAVALDGRPHTIRYPLPGEPELQSGTWHVMAVDFLLADQTEADLIGWGTNPATIELSVTVAGSSPSGEGNWSASGDTGPGEVRPLEVTVGGDTVRVAFSYSVLGLSWQDAHLRLLSFPSTTEVPVALGDDLSGELGLVAGDRIGLTWGTTSLTARVVRTVGYVPGHVREAAVLTDLRSLQRALLSAGDLEPTTDAWWVAAPGAGAADRLRSMGQGPVTDRTEEATALREGPLRAPLPLAWQLAIAASVALAVTGSAANASAEARSRGTTLARVRALGLSRREALASQLAQDLAVLTTGVALGGVCGALLGVLLIPLLVTSPAGERAVPAVSLVWPGGLTAGALGAILIGALLAGLPATLSLVGRSTVAALRAGEAP